MALPLLVPLLTGAAGSVGAYGASKGLDYLFGGNKPQGGRSATSQFFGGTPGRFEQTPRFTQTQERAFNQLLQQGLGGLQNPQEGFAPISNLARQQFMNQTVPSLAERFTAGSGGALSSPAFASQLGAAGSDLESNLAALGAQYGQNNQQNLLRMISMGLTPQFDTQNIGGQAGFGENAIAALGPILQLLPLLGRLGGEYKKASLGQGENLTPFWKALLTVTGGQA